MQALHILRSQPDAQTLKLIRATSANGASTLVRLDAAAVDYARLLDQVFSNARVVCWW